MRRIDPALVQAIQNATGTVEEIAARFGVSTSTVYRLRPITSDQITTDQIIDVYTSTEPDAAIAKRLKLSQAVVMAIRTHRAHTTITAGLPVRPRGRSLDRCRAEIEAERAASTERLRLRAERRAARIAAVMSSRDTHVVVARQLGIDQADVSRIRSAHGWVPPPKAAPKLKPVRAMKPKTPRSAKVREPKPPRPKRKPMIAEPREYRGALARATMWRAYKPTPPPPPAPKVNVRAELRRFIANHPVLSVLALSARLDLRLPWLSIIRAMPRPTGPAGPLGTREHKQVRPAERIKPGYLRARDPRAIVCRVYAVGDRPVPTGLGDPI